MQSVPITNKEPHSWRGVLDTTLCDKVCLWFSLDTPVSSTNKTDLQNITEILLKVALNTINNKAITKRHFVCNNDFRI
jgi:hypothetical protein